MVGGVEGQRNDVHDTVEDDPSAVHYPMGIDQMNGVSRNHDTVEVTSDEHKPVPCSRGEFVTSNTECASDTASVHSMPVVHVTEPQSSLTRRPTSSGSAESPTAFSIPSTSSSPARPHTSTADGSSSAQDRRDRHRSAIEVRSSSRLSGFFTNFMNRREPGSSPFSSRNVLHEDRSQPSPTPGASSPPPPPRPSSPARATTPPPQLPPPTLQELGLALSVVTSDLSPSHFSAPPWSGAFLEPHYLLLCHTQGLDVLPLVSPPVQQPYALVRRVCFKSVVVMEQRGVLVAIAGRRDGVRVYALEDVKKFVEWRIDFEVRRERERMRREAAKKVSPSSPVNSSKLHNPPDKKTKSRLSNPSSVVAKRLSRNSSHGTISSAVPSVSKAPSIKKVKPSVVSATPEPSGCPPPYQSSDGAGQSITQSPSVNNFLAGASSIRSHTESDSPLVPDAKPDWQEGSSDDEAIDIVAAGISGSQALDERTSAIPPSTPVVSPTVPLEARPSLGHHQSSLTLRRNRPANLDLSLSRTSTTVVAAPPSPTPTLITLRQALSQYPGSVPGQGHTPNTPPADVEDDEEEEGGISLVQALLESRLPDLPPIGSRCPQQPILFTVGDSSLTGPRTSDAVSHQSSQRTSDRPERRRRRWSVLDGVLSNGTSTRQPFSQGPLSPSGQSNIAATISTGQRLFRSQSGRSLNSASPATSTQASLAGDPLGTPLGTGMPSPVTPSRSRFLPRIFSNALHPRRSEEQSQMFILKGTDNDGPKSATASAHPTPPPKLEYVKLPGTKAALLIKAVETAKKSFLAILCGENGEKVELFAGTYRTALGLSRTFILPDSPRSLELQLQGDDLVEIFLVFSQNVFGLEPATVRVREVRIGRAERRAARRRARELRTGESVNDSEGPLLGDEEPSLNVNDGVTVAIGSSVVAAGEGEPTTPLPSPPIDDSTGGEHFATSPLTHADELVSLATAQAGPYTSFQQLSFAPKFPLASIADDYIIPPTYPDFLQYRVEHEPEVNGSGNADLARIQFSPPGLPVPVSIPPSKWFYRDPKGIVHGPWKASLMQAWYKDGLLPPDLPVKTEGETEFVLLKDLRLQSVDPIYPFRSPPPPPTPEAVVFIQDSAKPLLQPISLLSQPKHFGPPALFFSSRGGHSTSIVDARGKSVLKGRFLWSDEHDDDSKPQTTGRMGDVKRLETFNVKDRAVLVAMRQGGLEAVDLGDALLRPADESRTMLPQFCPPPSNTNRRSPFVWKIGTPVFSSPTSSTILSSKSKGSLILPGKKHSTGSVRTPVNRTEFSIDGDDTHDEVLFLGRKNDDIYMCERNAGSFRILRLCPS